MAKRKKNATKSINKDYLTREEYEEYLAGLYGMEFIAGYTEGGVPYGNFIEEDTHVTINNNVCDEWDDEIPF